MLSSSPAYSQETAQKLAPISKVLSRDYVCNAGLSLRSSQLSREQELKICRELAAVEARFQLLFAGKDRVLSPVAHDHNTSLRANIYANKKDYEAYAPSHFSMPVDNGGMYLEGLPQYADNHAEFVAYQRQDGAVHNLEHEYVHYLDGRFNLYGDFCANLHDSHSPPENCAKPAPLRPYLVWWTEGVAEYVAHGDRYASAAKVAATQRYVLSQLFDTGYESENGSERIYAWGYLAVRFMFENKRAELDQMLRFTRTGDYPRYQALVRSWGTQFDAEFTTWLGKISTEK